MLTRLPMLRRPSELVVPRDDASNTFRVVNARWPGAENHGFETPGNRRSVPRPQKCCVIVPEDVPDDQKWFRISF